MILENLRHQSVLRFGGNLDSAKRKEEKKRRERKVSGVVHLVFIRALCRRSYLLGKRPSTEVVEK